MVIRIAPFLLVFLSFLRTAPADTISGVVLRQDTLTPIVGAKVTLQASLSKTFTLGDGSFELNVPAGANRVIVGAAKGFFNSGVTVSSPTSGIQIILPSVPQDNDPAYQFFDPQYCGICHPNQFMEWSDTPMFNAGVNTWVHDIYNGTGTPGGMGGFVYTRDSIFAPTNPNSECASCHQPESWIHTPFSRMQGPQDSGYPNIAAEHGISCDICHKVADVDVSKINFPGIFPGAVTFTRPQGPTVHQIEYGLLGDTTVNYPSMMRASYQPQLMAEVCGVCHQDRSDPDENHTYTGPISEPTYLEWLSSPYSDPVSPFYANCVTCHMPPTGATTICEALNPPLERDPSTIHSHSIRGTTPQFLENALTMTMQTAVVGSALNINVTLANNLTGHHVPTGVTTRNMILLVEAWPAGGDPIVDLLPFVGTQTVHPLGGVGNPAQGYYSGRPGKLYAKVPHDAQNHYPAFFTDATGNVFDNRLAALQDDSTSYSFIMPKTNGDIRVRARVLYRRAWRALVDAKQWTQDGHGNPLDDVQPPDYGHLMETAEAVIPFCASPGTGDVNGDGEVNGLDIEGFVRLLIDSPNGPATGGFCAANIQYDLTVDLNDVGPFVSRLLLP